MIDRPDRDAVAEGVDSAFSWHLHGIEKHDVLEAIARGVKAAFDQLWAAEIEAAITEGVENGLMIDPDLVLDAIRDGAKAAFIEVSDE